MKRIIARYKFQYIVDQFDVLSKQEDAATLAKKEAQRKQERYMKIVNSNPLLQRRVLGQGIKKLMTKNSRGDKNNKKKNTMVSFNFNEIEEEAVDSSISNNDNTELSPTSHGIIQDIDRHLTHEQDLTKLDLAENITVLPYLGSPQEDLRVITPGIEFLQEETIPSNGIKSDENI